jgi:hypothetical protein
MSRSGRCPWRTNRRRHWSNNSVWRKVIKPSPAVTVFWEISGAIKTLFVSGAGFTDGAVSIKVRRGIFEVGFTGIADHGSFTASRPISCTSGEDDFRKLQPRNASYHHWDGLPANSAIGKRRWRF